MHKHLANKAMLLLSCLLVFMAIVPVGSASALFDNAKQQACSGVEFSDSPTNCTDDSKKINSTVAAAFNIFSIAIGIIAVLMIIIAGLRYITSAGDSNAITGAKNTLIYAIVGLVIVALAQVIVRYVMKKI